MSNAQFGNLRFDFSQPRSRADRIARIDALSTLLDTAFILPGTNIRFGFDAMIGLIPGIGDALAPLVLGVLHEARRFAGLRQLRGFCGLFPRTSSSGGVDKPGQAITQSGNNRIKRALYLAADAARRVDPGLAAVYWRLMVRKGHHHKQALCAVATRLANRIGKVLRTGEAYELRDTDGRPISVAEGRAIVAERFGESASSSTLKRAGTSPAVGIL